MTLKGQVRSLTSGQSHVVTEMGHIEYLTYELAKSDLTHVRSFIFDKKMV